MIEIGRYNQTTKDNRYCPFCGCNVIEDEVHFLFQCPTYSMIRNKFYYKVKTLIPNITQLPINGLINELMNSSITLAISRRIFENIPQNGPEYSHRKLAIASFLVTAARKNIGGLLSCLVSLSSSVPELTRHGLESGLYVNP